MWVHSINLLHRTLCVQKFLCKFILSVGGTAVKGAKTLSRLMPCTPPSLVKIVCNLKEELMHS